MYQSLGLARVLFWLTEKGRTSAVCLAMARMNDLGSEGAGLGLKRCWSSGCDQSSESDSCWPLIMNLARERVAVRVMAGRRRLNSIVRWRVGYQWDACFEGIIMGGLVNMSARKGSRFLGSDRRPVATRCVSSCG